jgi:hypothetical protein
MRALRASFLARRMASAWLLLTCLAGSVLITAALISALVSFYTGALPSAVRQDLAASGKMSVVVSGATQSSSIQPETKAVNAWMHAALRPVPYRLYRTVWSDDLSVPGVAAGGNTPVVDAASMADAGAFVARSSGTWPTAPRSGQPIPVALPTGTAAALKLRLGSVLTVRDLSTGATVRLRVTALFRRRDPSSRYWADVPIGPSGLTDLNGFASYGPALVSPAAFGGSGLAPGSLSFVALPAVARIAQGELAGLARQISAASASLQNAASLADMNVTTAMPGQLAAAARSLTAARSLLVISGLQLLLLSAAALALASRLLASHRDEETALLTARGAARWQLVQPSLAEAVLACAVAAVVGAVAGVRLASVLLAGVTGQAARLTGAGHAAWLAVAGVFLFCLAIVVWPALRPTGIAAVRQRRGRQATAIGAAAAGADVALVVLAVLCVRELRMYSAAAAGPGVDPVIAAAPALALAGLAIVPLRLLPVAARGLERLSARSKRLGAAMANWEISRRPVRQSGPVLLVILAVGTGTLALAQYQSWRQSVTDQANFSTGAQVRVDLTQAVSLAGAARISRLPGVTAAMAVSQAAYGSTSDELLAIQASRAAATVRLRPDLAAVPASALWRDITPRTTGGLALPGRPSRLAITADVAPGPVGQALGPLAALATIQDASGATYTIPAGTIAADGKPHDLIVNLAPAGGAMYPLRLLGVSLTYNWPPYAQASKAAAAADLQITGLAESAAGTGSFAPAFASGTALAHWTWAVAASDLEFLTRLGVAEGAVAPIVLSKSARAGVLAFRFRPGYGPDVTPTQVKADGLTGLQCLVTATVAEPAGALPAIATTRFLAGNGLHVGSVVAVPVGTATVKLHIVAAMAQFPTVTGTGAIIVDQAALQDLLVSQGSAPLPVTQWWLSTARGVAPPGLPAGSAVTVATGAASVLRRAPLAAAPVRAALAISAAAALLAAFGFCVSVAASARARRSQRALLSALGVSTPAQARLFCLEELMLSLPAAVVGLALGIGLAHVLIPALTLTPNAGIPVPAVLVKLPLAWVAVLAFVVAATPVFAAAVSALRQPDPAAELRAAEAG